MQGEINTDVSFYVKKLNNHAVRMAHSLYSRKALDECSLMNMWVADFLYNHRGEDVFQKDIEAEFFITRATASKNAHTDGGKKADPAHQRRAGWAV